MAGISQLLALNIYDTFYARSGKQWKGIGQSKAVVLYLICQKHIIKGVVAGAVKG